LIIGFDASREARRLIVESHRGASYHGFFGLEIVPHTDVVADWDNAHPEQIRLHIRRKAAAFAERIATSFGVWAATNLEVCCSTQERKIQTRT
jgi:hypothetical protein